MSVTIQGNTSTVISNNSAPEGTSEIAKITRQIQVLTEKLGKISSEEGMTTQQKKEMAALVQKQIESLRAQLEQLLRQQAEKKNKDATVTPDKKEEKKDDLRQVYVERAKDYIASSYSYPITVEDVADYTGISRSYLFRAFQAYQKQSPKEYLTEYRIRQACHLLRETGLSVASIAYSVGFEDNLYFSKAFKKKMQMSPSQYRKHHMP